MLGDTHINTNAAPPQRKVASPEPTALNHTCFCKPNIAPRYRLSMKRKATTNPIIEMACATVSTGSFSACSQCVESQEAESQITTPISAAIAKHINSKLRSRSTIDWNVCAPAVKRAISLFKVGVMPMSNKVSHACNTANTPISPYASIPR